MAVRLALVGLWGHEVYAQRLIAHGETHLVGVAGYPGAPAAMGQRLAELAAQHAVTVRADPGELLTSAVADLALIMVPPRLNAAWCALALEQGLQVASEKPVAGSAADARRLAAAVRGSRGFYTACLPLAAYSGPLLAARRAAAKLGGVRTAHFTYLASRGPLYLAGEPHYRDADLPKEALSGGEAAMFSGYGVVAIEACCGSRIRTVSATMASGFYPAYRAARMEDLAHLVVSLDNGAQATITVGRTPHPGAARIELELVGPNGDFRWSQAHDGAPQPDGIDAFVDDLVAAAQTGRAPFLGAAEVLSTVAVLGAAYRSAAVGEPVAVPDLLGEAGEGR